MNIVILGKGGREQAIQKALMESPVVQKIFIAPGWDSLTKPVCRWPAYPWDKTTAKLIKTHNIKLAIIGPEKELAEGAVDLFCSCGVPVFGPSQESAQLESSKLFAKHFMLSAGIPTSDFQEVDSVGAVLKASKLFGFPLVLKADGLAGGKGVFICHSKEVLKEKAINLFEKQIFGPQKALIEQFQTGWEMSVFVLLSHPQGGEQESNQMTYQILPFVRDYKKLKENNQGPNTGGMGAFAPHFISPELRQKIEQKIVALSVQAIQKNNFFYRGVLYIGLMIVNNTDPIVLEYNVRFGDPETQVLLPLLQGDWAKVFLSVAQGSLPDLKWKTDFFASCVVLAGEGYPEKTSPPVLIEGDIERESPYSYFLPAGAQKNKSAWFTKGGRVLNAIGLGASKKEALQRAYDQASHVHWSGMQKRSDIGS